MVRSRFRSLDFLRRLGWAGVFAVLAVGSALSCSGMPSLEEQERHVRANKLVLQSIDPPRVCRGMGGADISAYRVHAVLRHERRRRLFHGRDW